jgi:prolyl-tRNA synthetase
MSGIDGITKSLAALSVKPAGVVDHGSTDSPAAWKEALEAHSSTPKPYELLKTVVYKPKTAKTATPVPVVVIAREESEVTSTFVGKTLNLKELRLASEDLLTEFFSLDKNSRAFIATTINLPG